METHGLNILVDPKEAGRNRRPHMGADLLVQWVVERVEEWERHRNSNYMERWDEYYRIWRTEWDSQDRNREVERSRIMPTDLSEAVNRTTSELVDAFFGRKVWLDMADDIADANPDDVRNMAAKLREDADTNGVKQAASKAIFYGALYGTSILKISVANKEVAKPTQIVDEFGRKVMGGVVRTMRPFITATPISPREFVIDPAARSVNEALGCAHIVSVPRHTVLQGQRDGIYKSGDVPEYTGSQMDPYTNELRGSSRGMVKLTEYHGLVPAALLPGRRVREGLRRKIVENQLDSSVEMTEAIVLIANDSFQLKGVENPFKPQMRGIVAAQYEQVPDAFWGRGVVEAGYHPYKALQTEIRARADGLALANYPTVWRDEASVTGDQTRDDPDEKIIVPGKEYLTSGNPNEAIREFKFSGPDRGTTQAIADYQRMIESATGTFGFQGANAVNKDSTVAGSSVALSTFMRRAKATAANIERDLLQPLITHLAWRSMQFMPQRFPPVDFSFTAKGTMGILERDAERATLIEMMSAIPPESPAFYAVMRLIVESGPYEQREELLAIMDGLISASLNPPPPPRDLGGEARLISAQQRVREWEDQKVIRGEEFKREDVELMLKAKDSENRAGPAATKAAPEEVNINLNQGRKRVVIRRTDEGLVGETEDLN